MEWDKEYWENEWNLFLNKNKTILPSFSFDELSRALEISDKFN